MKKDFIVILFCVVAMVAHASAATTVFTADFEDAEVNPGRWPDSGVINTTAYSATQPEAFKTAPGAEADGDAFGWQNRDTSSGQELGDTTIVDAESYTGSNCAAIGYRTLRSDIEITLEPNSIYTFSFWMMVPSADSNDLTFWNKTICKDQTNGYYFALTGNGDYTTAPAYDTWFKRTIMFDTTGYEFVDPCQIDLRIGTWFGDPFVNDTAKIYTDNWSLEYEDANSIDITAHIVNPSFETPAGLFPGDTVLVEGWDWAYGRGDGPKTVRPSSTPYPTDGDNYLDPRAALMAQTLGTIAIEPNTIYTLSVDVFAPAGEEPNSAYLTMGIDAFESIERLATFGSTWQDGFLWEHLGYADSTTYGDTWHTVSCSFSSTAIDPELLGETLYIFAHGDWIRLDNFTLTAAGRDAEVTQVNLTVAVDAGAEDAILVPAGGDGTYPVGDGWVVPLDAMAKFVDCPDLYTFSQWAGADVNTSNITEVTISGNTTVTAEYDVTSPGCVDINEWDNEFSLVTNGSFEQTFTDGYGNTLDADVIDSFAYGSHAGGPNVPSFVPGWDGEQQWGYAWYPDTNGVNHWFADVGLTSVSDGNVAYGSWGVVGHYYGIWQNTGAQAAEGDTVTLSFDLNSLSADYGVNAWMTAKIQFIGGGEAVFTYDNSNPQDTWATWTLETTVTAGQAGKDIQIFLQGAGVWVDNVSLVRTALGIPATFTMDSDPAGADLSPADVLDINVPIGFEASFAAVGPDVVVCPEVYDFNEWQGGNGRITRLAIAAQIVLVDEDTAVTANYASNGTQYTTCGDICNPYSSMDLDYSCQVNFADFSTLALDWPVSPNTSLYIANRSFEYPVLGIGGYSAGEPAGWELTGNDPWIYNLGYAADGRNLITVNAFGSSFYQVPGSIFEANTTYRLMVDVMVPSYDDGVGYWVPESAWWQFYLQTTNPAIPPLASAIGDDTDVEYDQWYTVSCDFDSSTDPARVGEGIQISFTGANLYMDNFRLVKMEDINFDYLAEMAEQWLDTVP